MTSQQIQLLIDDVESRTGDKPTPYTLGYIDALKLVRDDMEEEEEWTTN